MRAIKTPLGRAGSVAIVIVISFRLDSYRQNGGWLYGWAIKNPARWPGEILKNRFNKMVFTVQTYAIIVNLSSLH